MLTCMIYTLQIPIEEEPLIDMDTDELADDEDEYEYE